MTYTGDKLFEAVECLACSDLPLRQRLEHAALALVVLTEDDFGDDEQRHAFAGVHLATSPALREPGPEGSISAAMNAIDDERAVELARSILSLYEAHARGGAS